MFEFVEVERVVCEGGRVSNERNETRLVMCQQIHIYKSSSLASAPPCAMTWWTRGKDIFTKCNSRKPARPLAGCTVTVNVILLLVVG